MAKDAALSRGGKFQVDEMVNFKVHSEPPPIISYEISLENGGDPGSNPGGSVSGQRDLFKSQRICSNFV